MSDPTGRAEGGPRFTPGPWKVNEHRAGGGANGCSIIGASGLRVVSLPRIADRPYGQKEADAQLMAAAPDLYAALKALVAETERCDNPIMEGVSRDCEHMEQARAALARADGR